ncbi:MAG: hypothetical protein ACAH95_06895 [Fimbriimonas sp.]
METRPKPSKLSYLTVQDILWINLQVTKKTNRFNYATLEEATYYQYAYGDSDELVSQASRFLRGFLKLAPLSEGNEATAFVAFAAFLMLNEHQLDVADDRAVEWFRRGSFGSPITQLEHGHSHSDAVRDVVMHVLQAYPRTVSELSGRSVAVIVDGAIH